MCVFRSGSGFVALGWACTIFFPRPEVVVVAGRGGVRFVVVRMAGEYIWVGFFYPTGPG